MKMEELTETQQLTPKIIYKHKKTQLTEFIQKKYKKSTK